MIVGYLLVVSISFVFATAARNPTQLNTQHFITTQIAAESRDFPGTTHPCEFSESNR